MPTRAHVRASKRTSTLWLLLLLVMPTLCFFGPPGPQTCQPDPEPKIAKIKEILDKVTVQKQTSSMADSTQNFGPSSQKPKSGKR